MRPALGAIELAMEAEVWTVQLRDQSEIEVLAHAYSVEDGYCIFSLLFKGEPHFLVTSLRLPLALLPEDFT
jgi:hypothetical protein